MIEMRSVGLPATVGPLPAPVVIAVSVVELSSLSIVSDVPGGAGR